MANSTTQNASRTGMKLVIILGLVSLFADMTYESTRAITGPYLALLGASAALVGFVSGAGELIGYGLRYFSGRWADHSKRYWTITTIGYALNMLAIPLLALAGRWEIAAGLLILERMGKAIRNPARDAILSHATHAMGRGWGFGLHRAMDQTGAILGPLLMSAILAYNGHYQTAFAVLLIPALLALLTLALGPLLYPHPQELEVKVIQADPAGQNRTFWLYLIGAALIGAGYVDFPLIAFHLKKNGMASDVWIPVLYSAAMAAEGISSPMIGKWFDCSGLNSVILASLLAMLFVPLVFFGGGPMVMIGMVLWGLGLGAQESAMKAAVANLSPPERRASTYGLFNMGYGVAWFIGSVILGLLYDNAIPWLVAFSLLCQLAALPFLWTVRNRLRQ